MRITSLITSLITSSNKAIKDKNDAMHNMMTTIMDRLVNSNTTPDAVATGPKNKGPAVPTVQPTATGSEAWFCLGQRQ